MRAVPAQIDFCFAAVTWILKKQAGVYGANAPNAPNANGGWAHNPHPPRPPAAAPPVVLPPHLKTRRVWHSAMCWDNGKPYSGR